MTRPKRRKERVKPTGWNAWGEKFYYPPASPDWSADDSVIEPQTAPWAPTHMLGCEPVRVLEDRTHRDYGFLYGEAHVEASSGERRWAQFGRYNYQEMEAVSA